MPLEIRELHIRVDVGAPPAGAGGSAEGTTPRTSQEQGEDRERLVAQCVEEVMQLLRNRRER